MTFFSRVVLLAAVALSGCVSPHSASNPAPPQPPTHAPATAPAPPKPGDPLVRTGDEIMVCGQLIHTTAPVVLWFDPDGYDGYRVPPRFSAQSQPTWDDDAVAAGIASPARYSSRNKPAAPDAGVTYDRQARWTLDDFRGRIDQLVLHYDQAGSSRRCFNVLHDHRGLSIHFMLDLDGTIYQTLDLKEKAWHATIANDRSIGVEIANVGAYRPDDPKSPLRRWYQPDAAGNPRIVFPVPPAPPERPALLARPVLPGHPASSPATLPATTTQPAEWVWVDPTPRTPGFIPRPARPSPIVGQVQGQTLEQYDLTPEQYESLIRLTAALCKTFPNIRCDYPRDAAGRLIPHQLTPQEFHDFHGILGHYHIQQNKIDPGPALDWDRLITRAQDLLPPDRSEPTPP